mgnify:CR=1 FL=1
MLKLIWEKKLLEAVKGQTINLKFLNKLKVKVLFLILNIKFKYFNKINKTKISEKFKVINKDPFIGTKRFFLSERECDHVKTLAITKLKRSVVISNNKNKLSSVRSSKSCYLDYRKDDITLNLVKRLSEIVGLNYESIPYIEVSRYRTGEFFAHHYDAFNNRYIFNKLENNKYKLIQRFLTAICYLNTTEEGGETSFPVLKKKIFPEIGKVLLFENTKNSSLIPNPKSFHSGDPVRK